MKAEHSTQKYSNLEAIDVEIFISNISPRRIKISGLSIEKTSLLVDSSERYKVILTPGHTHRLSFSENCRQLHTCPNTVKVEYVVEEADIDQFSKASFLLPLIPVIKYNIKNTSLSARVNHLWDQLTMSWQEVLTQKLNPDQEFFPNSKDIVALMPNLCESEELNVSNLPADEVRLAK